MIPMFLSVSGPIALPVILVPDAGAVAFALFGTLILGLAALARVPTGAR